jgi:hypothetical protein
MTSSANLLTREEFIRRVLYSGEVTRIGQHLAMVIFLVAEGKNQLNLSVRDLERITGWSRPAIKDHLAELEVFVKHTFGRGRAKALFELQGCIEDALATAVVAGSRIPAAATRDVVTSHAAANLVADEAATTELVASRVAASVVASLAATTGVMAGQPAANPVVSPIVASQPATTPLLYRERESISISSLSKSEQPNEDGQVQLNGIAIYGPGFKIDYAAIDLAAGMIGMTKDRARAIAEICARDWAINGKKPASPMATVKRAMMSDFNEGQVHDVRLEAARSSGKPKESRAARLLRHVEEAAEKGGRS